MGPGRSGRLCRDKNHTHADKWAGLHITSIAIATAAALHFAMYSSVLGVPLYTPRPGSSATPVYNPCHYGINIVNSHFMVGITCVSRCVYTLTGW